MSVSGPLTGDHTMPTISLGLQFRRLIPQANPLKPDQPLTYRLMGQPPISLNFEFGSFNTTRYSAYAQLDTEQLQEVFGISDDELDDITGDIAKGDFKKLFSFIDSLTGLFSDYDFSNDVQTDIAQTTQKEFYFRFGPTIWLASGNVYNPQKRFQFSPAGGLGLSINGLVLGKDFYFGGGLVFDWTAVRVNAGPTHIELAGFASSNYNHEVHTGEDAKKHGAWGDGQLIDFQTWLTARVWFDVRVRDNKFEQRFNQHLEDGLNQLIDRARELPEELENNPIIKPEDMPF
ncbi:hypothetical protein K1X76_09210 [bacterium]|nr:hypothetical protein [bacterium]